MGLKYMRLVMCQPRQVEVRGVVSLLLGSSMSTCVCLGNLEREGISTMRSCGEGLSGGRKVIVLGLRSNSLHKAKLIFANIVPV